MTMNLSAIPPPTKEDRRRNAVFDYLSLSRGEAVPQLVEKVALSALRLLAEARRELNALKAENARLQEALVPFAEDAEGVITVGDCRRLISALKKKKALPKTKWETADFTNPSFRPGDWVKVKGTDSKDLSYGDFYGEVLLVNISRQEVLVDLLPGSLPNYEYVLAYSGIGALPYAAPANWLPFSDCIKIEKPS